METLELIYKPGMVEGGILSKKVYYFYIQMFLRNDDVITLKINLN